ncbi:Vacuolar protein sorting-associated protein 41 [Polyrhizophydium stewartii]|uniref:Vacuolar protein sorting-associated protein 41 n=1 Tax=Polyrhizophydium stewartii TaxID=2732419 RepID=A0ABR4NKG7_9FUNG
MTSGDPKHDTRPTSGGIPDGRPIAAPVSRHADRPVGKPAGKPIASASEAPATRPVQPASTPASKGDDGLEGLVSSVASLGIGAGAVHAPPAAERPAASSGPVGTGEPRPFRKYGTPIRKRQPDAAAPSSVAAAAPHSDTHPQYQRPPHRPDQHGQHRGQSQGSQQQHHSHHQHHQQRQQHSSQAGPSSWVGLPKPRQEAFRPTGNPIKPPTFGEPSMGYRQPPPPQSQHPPHPKHTKPPRGVPIRPPSGDVPPQLQLFTPKAAFWKSKESNPLSARGRSFMIQVPTNEPVQHKQLKEALAATATGVVPAAPSPMRGRRVAVSADEVSNSLTRLFNAIPAEDELVEMVPAPPEFLGTLLPHQLRGLSWLVDRENSPQAGAILADDMGLGKTIQTIALVLTNKPKAKNKDAAELSQTKKRARATLIVAPLAVMDQWRDEIMDKTRPGSLKVIVFHGKDRGESADDVSSADVVITTYNILLQEHKKSGAEDDAGLNLGLKSSGQAPAAGSSSVLYSTKWFRIVLDEAHVIKNHKAQVSQAAFALRAKKRICLTGTPLHNNIEDLFGLFKFLRHDPFGNYELFKDQIVKPMKIIGSPAYNAGIAKIKLALKTTMLRRYKDTELAGKPLIEMVPRETISCFLPFAPSEKQVYDGILTAIRENMSRFEGVFVAALLRLRQACNHPDLGASGKDSAFDELKDPMDDLTDQLMRMMMPSDEPKAVVLDDKSSKSSPAGRAFSSNWRSSTKIREIIRLVTEQEDPTSKVIVFSYFTSMLDYIEEGFRREEIIYCRYDGTMSRALREETLLKFKTDPSVRVMLISTMCGAAGLNLVAANTVVLVDPWWNPMVEEQAIGRVHRLGQTRPVKVYRLIMEGSIEERVLSKQNDKVEQPDWCFAASKSALKLIEGAIGNASSREVAFSKDDFYEFILGPGSRMPQPADSSALADAAADGAGTAAASYSTAPAAPAPHDPRPASKAPGSGGDPVAHQDAEQGDSGADAGGDESLVVRTSGEHHRLKGHHHHHRRHSKHEARPGIEGSGEAGAGAHKGRDNDGQGGGDDRTDGETSGVHEEGSEEDEDEGEEDEEPKLKYQRLVGTLSETLKRDAVSCMSVSDRFLAVGTHWGVVHIMDLIGTQVKRFQSHSATVNQVSIDDCGDYVASASDDGNVVVNSLYTAEVQTFNFRRPVKAVCLEPFYGRKQTRQFVAGGMAESLVLSGKGWFGNSNVAIHSGEGPIFHASWRGPYILWASEAGVNAYDTATSLKFGKIERPENSPRADMFRCSICWKSDTTVLIGWADSVKIIEIKERSKHDIASGLSPKYVEVSHQFRTDFIVSGIGPLGDSLVLLGYITDLSPLRNVDLLDTSAIKRQKAQPPEIHIVDLSGESVASDVLSLIGFEYFQANDYHLDASFYIVSPKDIVVARPRDLDDHIQWLVERRQYADALRAAESAGPEFAGQSKVSMILDIGQKYIGTLMGEGRYVEAAEACPKLLRTNKELWEHWVRAFASAGQLQTITPFVPIDELQLSHDIYELILLHYLATDPEAMLQIVRVWPAEIYAVPAIVDAVHAVLVREPDSMLLMEILLELRQWDLVLYYGLRIRRPGIMDLVAKHNLFHILETHAALVMQYDRHMIDKMASIPDPPEAMHVPADAPAPSPAPFQVVLQLQNNDRFLHIYLDELFVADLQESSMFHAQQVELYAEFDYPRLMAFLRHSTHYAVPKAFDICEKRDLVPEMVFLLGKMGDSRRALMLIIERLGDVERAIQFAKDQNDEDLWEEFLKYSMDKPAFIVGLLENLSAHIDPLRVIRQIPNGLKIPGLRNALIKIMTDCSVQKSLREGCEKILMSDTWENMQSLHRMQRRGMRVNEDVQCDICGNAATSPEAQGADLVVFFCHHAFHDTCLSHSIEKALLSPHGSSRDVVGGNASATAARNSERTKKALANLDRAIDTIYARHDGESRVLAPLSVALDLWFLPKAQSSSMPPSVDIPDFINHQLSLIEKERRTEIEQVAALHAVYTPQDLQRRGVALLSLRVTGIRSGLGGRTPHSLSTATLDRLVDLEPGASGANALPPHKFRVGDIVALDEQVSSGRGAGAASKKRAAAAGSSAPSKDGDEAVSVSGVVYRVTDSVVTIAFKDDLPDKLPDKCRLSKLANNITYERMSEAMKALSAAADVASAVGTGEQANMSGPAKAVQFETRLLVQALFGQVAPSFDRSLATESISWFDGGLNDSQRDAVRFALSSRHVALIHGPPGTGKTYTCVELVRQLVKRGERVLVCGPSNISVDNLVERLAKCKLDIVRVGHPARVLDQVLQHALDVRVRSSDEGKIVNDVRREVDKTLQSISKSRNKAERRQMYQDVKALRGELRAREKTVVETIMRNAQVVLSTLNGAASRMLAHESFDTVLIDEATQALEAECWIAILKGKRLVLAGDHLQLPPTVISVNSSSKVSGGKKPKSKSSGPKSSLPSLEYTLFDRLLDLHGTSIKRLLNVQYRMNERIMKFSSDELYEGKLVAHESVKDRLLTDIDGIEHTDDTTIPLLLVDTSGQEMHEMLEADDNAASGRGSDLGGDSKLNRGEAEIVARHVNALVKAGVPATEIAVITPYNAQVNLLQAMLKETFPGLEIGSVDGFQGREKDAVVISLVRSNDEGEIGFLSDKRRMNVALTRARRHLFVVGDGDCVGQRSSFLKRMFAYFEDSGEVRFPDA